MKIENQKIIAVDDNRERTVQSYREWLEGFSWSWMATLKLTSGTPSMPRAIQLFNRWIADLRRAEGARDFHFFRVLERGTDGGNLHFHALVGGFRDRKKIWTEKWKQMGGDALISRYDPSRKGILYMLKDMAGDGDLNFDCDLPKRKSRGAVDDELQESKVRPATIMVELIDGKTSPAELKRLFKPYGRILETGILEGRIDGDRTLITATITYQNSYAASMAVEGRDGMWLRGRPLRVSVWGSDKESRQPKTERMTDQPSG